MHTFSALAAFAGFVTFASALPASGPTLGANGCPAYRLKIQQTGTCTTTSNCPYVPGTLADGTQVRGSYNDGNGYCVECPPGAWACNAQGPTNCIAPYSMYQGRCISNEQCLSQGNNYLYVGPNPNNEPRPAYLTCGACYPGSGSYANPNACTACPAELGRAATCTATKATSCLPGYVLYQDKCLDTKCPDTWYNDNGVCKTCVSQDPKSVLCELGKSLTCTRNQLLILSTNRCGTSACPYTPANGLPGSYRDGLVCRSCAPEAFNCDAGGALNCYNPNGVQYYRLDRTCVTKDQCLAAKPTSKLFTQLQTSTGVTYGTC